MCRVPFCLVCFAVLAVADAVQNRAQDRPPRGLNHGRTNARGGYSRAPRASSTEVARADLERSRPAWEEAVNLRAGRTESSKTVAARSLLKSALKVAKSDTTVRKQNPADALSEASVYMQADELKKEGRKCGIMWFYHLPKCGGMSVYDWIHGAKEAGFIDDIIQVFFSDFNPHLPPVGTSYDTYHNKHIEPLVANAKGKLVAVHHHHHTPGMLEFQSRFPEMKRRLNEQGCDLFRFTFLRNPESRLTSALVYNIFDWNRTKDSERELGHSKSWDDNTMNLVQNVFAKDSGASEVYNREVNYFLNNNAEDGKHLWRPSLDQIMNVTVAKRILRTFELVGLTEEMGDGISQLARMVGLGGKIPGLHGSRTNMGSRTTDPAELPRAMSKLIRNNTILDRVLYEEAVRIWAGTKLNASLVSLI